PLPSSYPHPLFFHHTSTTPIYTLSLHDALPICDQQQTGIQQRAQHTLDRQERRIEDRPRGTRLQQARDPGPRARPGPQDASSEQDRKSTRLNSSHVSISYAVFCLKKKKKKKHKK